MTNKPLDFFGNEIEVGDEVAYLYEVEEDTPSISSGVVTYINPSNKYFNIQINNYGFYGADAIIVNTEKKHREKAVEYHLSEMG